MGTNYDTRPFSMLLNDDFVLLNADLNDKQLTKCTYLEMPLSQNRCWKSKLLSRFFTTKRL